MILYFFNRKVFILNKLEGIEKQVRKQEEEIENYVKKNHIIDFNELVAAHLKSTKTSIELLREEIEELVRHGSALRNT